FRVGDGTVRVPAGSCVAAPPLLVHGFRNPGDEDARFLNLHAPGVWARGQNHGLPPELYDTFGADRASTRPRPIVSATGDGDRLTKEHRLALAKVQPPEHDLEVAAHDGRLRPPAVEHAPLFAQDRDRLMVHLPRRAVEVRLDARRARLVQSSRGTKSARVSGIRDHGATSTTVQTEPEPV